MKGRKNRKKQTIRRPQTVEEFFAMSKADQDRWRNVDQVVAEMRNGASLPQASRKFGLNPRTVVKQGGPALRKPQEWTLGGQEP